MRPPTSQKFTFHILGLAIMCLISFVVHSFPFEEDKIASKPTDIFNFGKPSLTKFTSTDGLPVNAVMSIERDNRGFIWFATQDGAAVFNGYEFNLINMPNRAVSNYIHNMMAASDGSFWFATGAGGVHRLKNGEWQTFDKDSGLGSNETRFLLETKTSNDESVIWVARRDGFSKFFQNKWENFDEKNGLPDKRVRGLLEVTIDPDNKELWLATYGGIVVWDGKVKKIFNEKDGLPGKVVFSLAESIGKDGNKIVWAGTNKGLAKFEKGRWIDFKGVSEVLNKTIRAVGKTVKANGEETVWVGSDGGGVAFFENDSWNFLDKKDGLPNNLIYAFAETGSPDGSVWMSNLGAGVSRFERSNWRVFDTDNGLPNNLVFTINETNFNGKKDFWIGTYGNGMARYSEGNWTIYGKKTGIRDDFIQTTLSTVDENGNPILYVGTEKGLVSFQNEKWEEIKLLPKKETLEIWDIKETKDKEGNQVLWISASAGLIRKAGDDIEVFYSKNGLPDDRVRATLETTSETGQKTIWAALYSGGLGKYENGKWKIFDKTNGLLTNRVYTVSEITTGRSKQLWVGTGGGGIAILDLNDPAEKFQIINTENSNLIPSDTVYQIFQDSKKRIYATTNKGVSRITPKDENEILNSHSYFFTTEDGLPNNECIVGASFIDQKGRVWIGTVGGVAVLDVSKEFVDEKAEPLFLQSVFISGEKKNLTPDTALSHDQNNLIFEYVMPTNFRESATVYRTQMVNLEDQPTDWTREPRREFTYIPSGDFVFKIWGKDASGNISEPLEIPFRIRPAWWQTWWAALLFLLATIAFVSFIAYLIYRNRYRRMLEIERVRTRIATDLHDDVGSSLSKISILSEVLAFGESQMDEEGQRSLKTIAETSRNVVSSMSDMVWSINPNRDNFRDTVQRMRRFASEVLAAREIDFTFDAPLNEREVKLDVDLRRQIYLVFKESLNNAVKYSDCTKVEIELKRKTDSIFLRVSDNGKGFDPEELSRGNGLINMRNRAEEIGGVFEINTEKGKGTTVTLKLRRRLGGITFPKPT